MGKAGQKCSRQPGAICPMGQLNGARSDTEFGEQGSKAQNEGWGPGGVSWVICTSIQRVLLSAHNLPGPGAPQ